ncbi:transposase [Treponema socranskii]|uniref:transposase n=1 Tax=Treponema socranskii TaxID=53419 RepID=UPI003D8A1D51
MTAEQLAGANGLLKQLASRFYSRALEAEMNEYLGYKKNDNAGDNCGNSRNGYTSKTVINEDNDTIEVIISILRLFSVLYMKRLIYSG